MKNFASHVTVRAVLLTVCILFVSDRCFAQATDDPFRNYTDLNGITLQGFSHFDWRDSLDLLFEPIHIDYSDTTVFDNTNNIWLGFQWGSYGRGQKRLRENVVQLHGSEGTWSLGSTGNIFTDTTFTHNDHAEALLARKVRDEASSVALILENMYMTRYWFLKAPSMQWATSGTYWGNRGLPYIQNQIDTTGSCFTFEHRQLGTSQQDTSAFGYMDKQYSADSVSSGFAVVLSKPAFNRVQLRSSTIFTPTDIIASDTSGMNADQKRKIAKDRFEAAANGSKNYLLCTLRRLDVNDTVRDTSIVCTVKIPYWYRTLVHTPVTHTEVRRDVIRFDSVFALLSTTDTVSDTRGCMFRQLHTPTELNQVDSLLIIRRRDIPLFVPGDSKSYLTVGAYYKTSRKDEANPRIESPNLPHSIYRDPDPAHDFIDSIDLIVEYYGQLDIGVRNVTIECPVARAMHLGRYDTLICALASRDLRRLDTINKLLHSRVKLKSWYLLDEPDVEVWHTQRYIAKLLGSRVTTEGYTGLAYLAHVPQQTYWSGFGFNMQARNVAPYVRKSLWVSDSTWGSPSELQLGINGGWEGGSFFSPDMLECKECKYGDTNVSGYGFPGRESPSSVSFHGLSHNTAYAMCGLEEPVANYYNMADALLAKKRIIAHNWIEVRWTYGAKYALPDSSNVLQYYHSSNRLRPHTGEEIRRMIWMPLCFGVKGVMYDGEFQDKILTLGELRVSNTIQDQRDSGVCVIKKRQDVETGLWYAGVSPHSLSDDSTGQEFILADSNGSDYFQFVPSAKRFGLTEYVRSDDSSINSVSFKQGVDTNRIYIGYRSMRYVMMKEHDRISLLDSILSKLYPVCMMSKGVNYHRAARGGDTSLFTKYIDMNWGGIQLAPIDSLFEPVVWDSSHSFVDVSVMEHDDYSADSIFYVVCVNRDANPLVRVAHTGIDSLDYNFFSTFEFDSLTQVSALQKHDQIGAKQIRLPFCYKGEVELQGKFLHIVELAPENPTNGIDTVISTTNSIDLTFLPGEGKILRVEVLSPVDADVSSGSIDFANQRKIIAMPLLVRRDTINNRGVYDSTRVVYHIVYSRQDTLYYDPLLMRYVTQDRVYYQRSKIVDRLTQQDVNPLNPYLAELWDTTMCISNDIYDTYNACMSDSLLVTPSCKYPSLVVRYDANDNKEYVYVVYTCFEPYPTHPKPLAVVESQFGSTDTIPEPINMVVDRPDYGTLEQYGHASINASSTHNYYAWSTYNKGIRIASRTTSANEALRCRTSSAWRFGEVSWWGSKNGSAEGAECAHPSLNTYSRLSGEDECALVWEESRISYGMPSDDHNWHIYYTQLRHNGLGLLDYGLPTYKTDCTSILDTCTFDIGSYAKKVRVSRYSKVNDGYQVHKMPSVVRDLQETNTGTKWDNVVWSGQNGTASGGLCTSTTGILSEAVWSINDSLKAAVNNRLYSCLFEFSNPSMTWASSYTHDSDIVINFDADYPPLGDWTIGHIAKSYWHMATPCYLLGGGHHPHLSASPIVFDNVQWMQVRRLASQGLASENSPLYTSVKRLFKTGIDDFIGVFKLVGYEGASGGFSVCDYTEESENGTMSPLFYGMRERVPSDTIFSNWFVVNNKKLLRFMMKGNYDGIAHMYVENQRTGLSEYVDLSKVVPDTIQGVQVGAYSVVNGGADTYRVLLVKGQSDAVYREDQYIDFSRFGYSKTASDESVEYAVDLATVSGMNADCGLRVYPNPAEDEAFFEVGRVANGHAIKFQTLQVRVSDVTGSVVQTFEIKAGETLRVSVVDLSPGVYSVNLYNKDAGFSLAATTRVVVLR